MYTEEFEIWDGAARSIVYRMGACRIREVGLDRDRATLRNKYVFISSITIAMTSSTQKIQRKYIPTICRNPIIASSMPKIAEYTIFRGSPSGTIITETIKRPIESHEALVEITHAGICGSDKVNKRKDMPLGHHGSGKIINIGDHVEQVSIGDYVGFAGKQKPCGYCDPCIGGTFL